MAPECNKYEAYKFISLAKSAIAAGKRRKAKNFLLKAQELYPTANAERLLANLSDEIPSTSKAESPRARASSSRKRLSSACNSEKITYGPKQEKAIREVLECENYYELFGVSRDASTSEIEKSYKKLALRLHPDKNRAPGASEAFKKVNEAKNVLTDSKRRQKYDTEDNPDNTNESTFNNLDINLRPSDDVIVAVSVIGGAILGGFLAYKLIKHFQNLQKNDTSTVAPMDSNNNKSRRS